MVIKDKFPCIRKLPEAEWYYRMEELENIWLLAIAEAQSEYQENYLRLERGLNRNL